MKAIIKRCITVVLLVLICFACNQEEVSNQVEKEVIMPYFQLLQQEKYQEAYTHFTSDFYKKHSSWEVYRKSYQDNITKRGKLEKYSFKNVSYISSLFGKDEITVHLFFKFKNEPFSKPILLVLSQNEQGKYLIDAAWHHNKYAAPDGLDGPF